MHVIESATASPEPLKRGFHPQVSPIRERPHAPLPGWSLDVRQAAQANVAMTCQLISPIESRKSWRDSESR